ncbi:MAG: 16S rRNA (uracil(1498)-N(3))-methyltransferase [Kiritimatiellae bacterium]|nr:16S rRNA (uracil(1498)-N(3))-methyltransferase [Kiritimatiellia bacterium]
MNRILFEKGEIAGSRVVLNDGRARHITEILHGEPGQTLKTGEIDGPIGTSTIVAIGGDGSVTLETNHGAQSLAPWIDIILAPPRPRVMKRLLPQLAAMGAGRIVLAGAKKVEKDFWGATLLKEENFRPLLVEGLMQAGTSILPEILLRRNFRTFLLEELDTMFPQSRRIVAHPAPLKREGPSRNEGRILLAVGPEGGWTEDELALLSAKGFAPYSLGPRILKTETACIALMARLGEGER